MLLFVQKFTLNVQNLLNNYIYINILLKFCIKQYVLCNFLLQMKSAAIRMAFTKSSISAVNACLISPKKEQKISTYKALSPIQIKVHYLNFDIYFKFLVGQFELSFVSVGISV